MLKFSFVSKIVSFFKNVFEKIKFNWTERKSIILAKIICFFAGLIFNVIGIIAVALWKWIFCKDSEKFKYCIRLSIFGWFTHIVIFIKLFTCPFFYNFSYGDKKHHNNDAVYYQNNKGKHHNGNKFGKERQIVIKNVFIDDFFEKEIFEMNKMFDRQRKMFDEMFAENEIENNKVEIKNEETGEKNDIKTTKEVIDNGDGYKKTIVEKEGPNFYKKVVKESYDSRKARGGKIKDKKAKKNKSENKNKK